MDTVYRAWETGDPDPTDSAETFADGIAAQVPFAVPLAVLREHLEDFRTVSDSAIVETVARLFKEERILME